MEHLVKIKNSFLKYLSPPQNKRRRTVNPATTPDAREHKYAILYSDPQDKRAQAAVVSRFNGSYVPGIPNPRKRAREDDEDSTVFSVIEPDDSISQTTPVEEDSEISGITPVSAEEISEDAADDELGSMEEYEDDGDVKMEVEEDDVSAEEKVADYLARQEEARETELELRRKDVEAFKLTGKHEDEIYLFERMSMRGFEELLPAAWQVDFPTLPLVLFTADPDRMFVNDNCISSSRAIKALQSLLTLGVRVRDNVSTSRPTARLIAKEIRSYMKWAEKDGGFDKLRIIPVLTVVVAQPGQSIDSITKELTCQMKFLAERHRDHLALADEHINELDELEIYSRQPPLLYGIVVAQTVAIVCTLDSADPDGSVRHLTHAQFNDKKMDAWNEFAIALTVIAARNYMMSIKDELEPDDEDSDPDPDA